MMSETSHLPFNNVSLCRLPHIPPGQCLLYPGHTNNEWTRQSTAWAVGGAIGAFLSIYPAGRFGRQRTLGLNGVIMIAGAFVQMFATDIDTFAVGRGISGIASGVDTNVLNNYLREVAPKQWRMFYMVMFHVVSAATALIVSALFFAILKLPTSDWQFKPLFGGPIVIGLLVLATMRFIVESPAWLLLQHREDEAKESMARLYVGDVQGHFAELTESMRVQTEEVEASSSKLALLVSSRYRVQFAIAVVLGTMQQLAGLPAMVVYGPSIFKSVNLADLRLSNIFINFGRCWTMFIAAAFFGHRYMRRALLLRFSLIMCVAALGFTLCQVYPNTTTHWINLVCLLLFMGPYSFSVGSLGWVISTELIPEALAPTSGAFATFGSWTAQFLIGVFFQQITSPSHWGTQAFAIFSVIMLVFAIFAFFFVPETSNTTSMEVRALYVRDEFSSECNDHTDVDIVTPKEDI
ncbi:hypothetical protein LEN26_002967 [Aphanomyces euteiches]|nr:hypothetical protein LEN26_002967 [Aphanomyces euteiches]